MLLFFLFCLYELSKPMSCKIGSKRQVSLQSSLNSQSNAVSENKNDMKPFRYRELE